MTKVVTNTSVIVVFVLELMTTHRTIVREITTKTVCGSWYFNDGANNYYTFFFFAGNYYTWPSSFITFNDHNITFND
jgi:hypothetical protein